MTSHLNSHKPGSQQGRRFKPGSQQGGRCRRFLNGAFISITLKILHIQIFRNEL